MNLFQAQDFRQFLEHKIKENKDIRGYRSRLAEAAGIQRSFLSHVLHSPVLLTPDHALKLCEFWNFNRDETEYFVDLVHVSRAQTPGLRRYYQRRLTAIRTKYEDLSQRLERPKLEMGGVAESLYYGTWFWSAIHIATGFAKYRTPQAIAERLRLDPTLVQTVLMELQNFGLVKKIKDHWQITEKHLHLPKDSPFIVSHHTNWHQRAIYKLQQSELGGFHYSVIFGVSKADRERLKQLLYELVDKTRQIIEPSQEDDMLCFIVDLFDL